MSKKEDAVIVKCSPDEGEHMMRDNCFGCAPFWYLIPKCPKHKRTLNKTGYCRQCVKFYKINK